MTITEKSQFGVNMMVFVFLLSLVGLLPYGATAIGVSDVYYVPLNDQDLKALKASLIAEINNAKRDDEYFYIGAAKANGTPIQSLCSRQGVTDVKPDAIGCTTSSHKADGKAKLKRVYYTNRILPEPGVCDIEKELIEDYLNVEPKCLNERAGHPCCIEAREGIVYLRIYEKRTNHKYPTRNGKRCREALEKADLACSTAD